ncbi:hypothetical protein [Rhodoferax mekongensis]|uniref:hypothetical protein n=1 Tax=Rhodoferax mekongensis TaxID=3068341 RepID=UPI0028BEA7F3|nr:hypothetical protein [Rhodoferax sp. TBRC 17199]MDT7514556.1 hypothetical protein [Rhodoferax sp. TBRC 17199]
MTTTNNSNVFESYEWALPVGNDVNVPASVMLTFAEKVHAITSGSEVILRIAEKESIDADLSEDEQPSYLGNYRLSAMVRMVRQSMEFLSNEAERINEWTYEVHTKEGRERHYRSAANRLKAHGEKLPKLGD